MHIIGKGKPLLGASIQEQGVQFGIYAVQDCPMILKLYRGTDKENIGVYRLNALEYRTGLIYHIVIAGVNEGDYYTWQIEAADGSLSEVLIDPYARAVEEIIIGSNRYYSVVAKSKVYEGCKPLIKWEDTVIYELHVGAFTKGDRQLDEVYRGTFDGVLSKLDYLKSLGITSIELLPIYKWNKRTLSHKNPLTGKPMEDVWGYNPISFFALQEDYIGHQDPLSGIEAFRHFVEQVHQKGMEVILDVVYNHTGEGGEGGTVFHFKELGKSTYYKMEGEAYRNCTGTGNVLNTTHPVVKEMVITSLKYWILEMGVDGFRFDLASTLGQDEAGNWMAYSLLEDIAKDPIISQAKLISESWDAKGSYNVGKMPYPFAEWSDHYRDTIRKFVRGDLGVVGEVAKCVEGRGIYFLDVRKGPYANINFITAHDGFTLWDLVSYNVKHNELNGEGNRDGNDHNYSDNCGYEGETALTRILDLRIKRMKNYFTLLFFSYGVPMMLMGDEIGRSQKGNNNVYCQDNGLLWMDWREENFNVDLRDFVRHLLKLRKTMQYLKKPKETHIIWHGTMCQQPDWSYHSRSLGCEIVCEGERLFIVMNNYHESLVFVMLDTTKRWMKIIDTAREQIEEIPFEQPICEVMPYSIILFKEVEV